MLFVTIYALLFFFNFEFFQYLEVEVELDLKNAMNVDKLANT